MQRDKDLWYKPLVDYDDDGLPISDSARAITTGSVRQRTRGLMRPRNMQASPAQQKQEVVESAIKTLNKLPRVNGIDGVRYDVLMIESESLLLWDESREIIVHEQRVDFYDDRPPTTETILGRPLRNFALPDGMYRSWDLHPDTFKSFDHGCVVQMFFKSLTKKASGQARKNGNKNRVPMYSIEHIQNELDKVFIECGYEVGEAPFEDGDWREFGATGEMIIKYCQKLNVNCYVHHGRNLLTYMAPEQKAGMAIVNISI